MEHVCHASLFPFSLLKVGDHFMYQRSPSRPVSCPQYCEHPATVLLNQPLTSSVHVRHKYLDIQYAAYVQWLSLELHNYYIN